MALDERLRRELDRAAQPADPSGLYEHLIRRRERRRIARRVQSGVLAVVVLLGSVGGFYTLTRIFREAPPREPATPSVSNGLIVFSREIPGEGEHLFAASPDWSKAQRLTPEGRAVYRSPDISPDGRTILVVHEIPSFEPGQSVLATIPIDGGAPTWLSEETWVVLDPTWSSDGTRIAFAGSPGGPFGIYVVGLETGDARLVPGTDEISVGGPTWSPDGSRIAFEASTDADTDPDQSWDIFTVRLDGSQMTNLTGTPNYSEIMPAWSWTLDRIAFIEVGPAEGALLAMASTGRDAMTVYSGEFAPANPAWSPYGAAIAFEGGSEGIFTVGTDGTGVAALPDARGGEPAWQPPIGGVVVPEPTPSPTPSVGEDQDIGLGFPVCNVTSVSGVFAPGVDGAAFVATKMGDTGECRRSPAGFQVLAVDISGDGLADASYGPLECEEWCNAWAAPDVDGDGTDELLVQNIQFSINGLLLYDVRLDPAEIVLVTVASPGDIDLFPADEPPQLWFGGDGFNYDDLACSIVGGIHPVFISSTASQRPPESGPWHVHETTFQLVGRQLEVVSARDYETIGGLLPRPENGRICGAALPLPWSELY